MAAWKSGSSEPRKTRSEMTPFRAGAKARQENSLLRGHEWPLFHVPGSRVFRFRNKATKVLLPCHLAFRIRPRISDGRFRYVAKLAPPVRQKATQVTSTPSE
jgi:hypothetical protein